MAFCSKYNYNHSTLVSCVQHKIMISVYMYQVYNTRSWSQCACIKCTTQDHDLSCMYRVYNTRSWSQCACIKCTTQDHDLSVHVSSVHKDHIRLRSGNSAVGWASNRKARGSTNVGSSPLCGKRFFSQSHLPVETLTVSVQPPIAIACINIWAHVTNPKQWQPYHCLDTGKYHTHW